MPNLTYTVEGNYTTNRQANINICIPSESSAGIYTTGLYNLSKSTSNGVINAIFCHFSDHSSDEIQHNSFDFRMNFDLDKLNNHPKAVHFDETQNEALFIFFHNTDFDSLDRDLYFAEIENIYHLVKNHGNQSQNGILNLKINVNQGEPRKVGMSLVTKVR